MNKRAVYCQYCKYWHKNNKGKYYRPVKGKCISNNHEFTFCRYYKHHHWWYTLKFGYMRFVNKYIGEFY